MAELILRLTEILVPALIAAIAAIAATIISVWQIRSAAKSAEDQIKTSTDTAMLQYRAQVLSANRQNWINTLRDLVSEICADISVLSINFRESGQTPLDPAILARFQKLRLMLNPKEEKSEMIFTILDLFGDEFEKGKDLNEDAILQLRSQLITRTQAVLKEEWERVKSGV